MAYYSDPVTPPVVKATALPDVNGDLKRGLNATIVPEYGTGGPYDTAIYPDRGQEPGVNAHGEANANAAPSRISGADLEAVMEAVRTDMRGGGDSLRELKYYFDINDTLPTLSTAQGIATMPSFILPAWPEDWNNTYYHPEANPPENATGWEILEPGYVTGAYLVTWHAVKEYADSTGVLEDEIAASVVLGPGESSDPWSGGTAELLPAVDGWTFPPLKSTATNFQAFARIDPEALPATAYVLLDLYQPQPNVPREWQPWLWRWVAGHQRNANFEASVDMLVVYEWQPPTYRWVLSSPPQPKVLRAAPLRVVQRGNDGLGITGGRRIIGAKSTQATNRRGTAFR